MVSRRFFLFVLSRSSPPGQTFHVLFNSLVIFSCQSRAESFDDVPDKCFHRLLRVPILLNVQYISCTCIHAFMHVYKQDVNRDIFSAALSLHAQVFYRAPCGGIHFLVLATIAHTSIVSREAPLFTVVRQSRYILKSGPSTFTGHGSPPPPQFTSMTWFYKHYSSRSSLTTKTKILSYFQFCPFSLPLFRLSVQIYICVCVCLYIFFASIRVTKHEAGS